jgi:hypothetical protein
MYLKSEYLLVLEIDLSGEIARKCCNWGWKKSLKTRTCAVGHRVPKEDTKLTRSPEQKWQVQLLEHTQKALLREFFFAGISCIPKEPPRPLNLRTCMIRDWRM